LNATELASLASQVFSTVSDVFSKPSLFQILYIYFLVWVFSEDNVTQKHKANLPRIKQHFCNKPKQKFLAVSQAENANTSSRECKGSFDSVAQEIQHSIVRISKASSISANSR